MIYMVYNPHRVPIFLVSILGTRFALVLQLLVAGTFGTVMLQTELQQAKTYFQGKTGRRFDFAHIYLRCNLSRLRPMLRLAEYHTVLVGTPRNRRPELVLLWNYIFPQRNFRMPKTRKIQFPRYIFPLDTFYKCYCRAMTSPCMCLCCKLCKFLSYS
jgi:hypothetical protein